MAGVCRIDTEKAYGIGVGVQSVLWAKATVFTTNSETQGNEYMYEVTKYALRMLVGKEGITPIELMDGIYEETFAFAKNSRTYKETCEKHL